MPRWCWYMQDFSNVPKLCGPFCNRELASLEAGLHLLCTLRVTSCAPGWDASGGMSWLSVAISLRMRLNAGKACKTAEPQHGYIQLCVVFVRHTRFRSSVRYHGQVDNERETGMTKARASEGECERKQPERENPHREKMARGASSQLAIWSNIALQVDNGRETSKQCG